MDHPFVKVKSEPNLEGRVSFQYTGSEQQIFQGYGQRQKSETISQSKKHRVVQWVESLVAEKVGEGVAKNHTGGIIVLRLHILAAKRCQRFSRARIVMRSVF